MLKFVKNHMDSIAGIEVYPLISFGIFFLFFLVLLVWTFKVDKGYIAMLKNIPLDKEGEENNPIVPTAK